MPTFKAISISGQIIGGDVRLTFHGILGDGEERSGSFQCPQHMMKAFCWDLLGIMEGVHPSQKMREKE